MDIQKEWVAGWGTLALINAALAQAKDRSVIGWFLVSLILGPLATLLLILVNDEKKHGRTE